MENQGLMINVAMLTPFFTGKLGGPYNVIMELAPILEQKGISTSIYTTSAIRKFGRARTEFFEEKSKNFKIYRFDSYLKFKEYRTSLGLLPFLLKNEKNIDLVHSHSLRSFQEDNGLIVSLIKKKPLIISPHGGISINWDYRDKIPKMISDKTIGYLKKYLKPHYIAVTKMEIPIIKEYGADDDHIHFIPHGVNTEIFKLVDSNQLKALNRSIKIIFYLFSVYTLLVLYSAFYMSNEAWAFISGGLFYILFGVYFVYELINNKLKQNKLKNEEWLPIVDEEGKVVGKAPRSVCHSDKNLLHPVVHLHVINKQNRIFLQKRPMFKKVQPGKWDTAVGGHISFNETLEQSLKRETFEEIGISDFNAKLIGTYKWESDIETELVYMFITNYNNGIKINNKELDKGKFWSINQINKNLGLGVFTPNFELEFGILKKQVLH